MNNNKFYRYICWGVTATIALAVSIAFVFFLIKIERVRAICRLLFGILSPIIYGAVMAYLMAPIYDRVHQIMEKGLSKIPFEDRTRHHISSTVATFVSLAVLIAIVTGLISMLIPQLIASIRSIIDALPDSIANLQRWLTQILIDHPEIEQMILEYYGNQITNVQSWLNDSLIDNFHKLDRYYQVLRGFYSGLSSVLNVVKNVLIGLIVMVYLLNMKDKLRTQAKMIVYGLFSVRVANKILEEGRYVDSVFGGFIIGKLVDSLIIGILSFILMTIMNMPYVLVVSVIIGVTNVIPFFGPFIGAIPSAFLILLVNPMKCLYFIVFILLLQQFDGNILGPRILGNSTGLSSFWVLFSILLFGGLFGFVGMIIGVPTFAVFYKLLTEFVTYRLRKKKLSADIGQYEHLKYIDVKNRAYIDDIDE